MTGQGTGEKQCSQLPLRVRISTKLCGAPRSYPLTMGTTMVKKSLSGTTAARKRNSQQYPT